jgi:hypothetical protein
MRLFYPSVGKTLNVFANKDKKSMVALEQMLQSGTLPINTQGLILCGM